MVVLLYISVAFPAARQADARTDAVMLDEIKNLFTSASVEPGISGGFRGGGGGGG